MMDHLVDQADDFELAAPERVYTAEEVRTLLRLAEIRRLLDFVPTEFSLALGRDRNEPSTLPRDVFRFSHYVDDVTCKIAKKHEGGKRITPVDWITVRSLNEFGWLVVDEMLRRNRLVFRQGLSIALHTQSIPSQDREYLEQRGKCFLRLRRAYSVRNPSSAQLADLLQRASEVNWCKRTEKDLDDESGECELV